MMKQDTSIIQIGAHRAAEAHQPEFIKENRPIHYVDVSARVHEMAKKANHLGSPSQATQMRGEAFVEQDTSEGPYLLTIDEARSVSAILHSDRMSERATVVQQIVRMEETVFALGLSLAPKTEVLRTQAARLFQTLSDVRVPTEAELVYAGRSMMAQRMFERGLRRWFSTHLKRHLLRALEGRSPLGHPLELSFTGTDTVPTALVFHEDERWLSPDELPHCITFKQRPDQPIAAVLECGRENNMPALRLHRLRRARNGQLLAHGSAQMSRVSPHLQLVAKTYPPLHATMQRPALTTD